MEKSEFIGDADVSGSTGAGMLDIGLQAQQIEIPYNDTYRQNFEKALIYWHKQNTLLYITCKNDAIDWLTVPAYSDQALSVFRGRVKAVQGYTVTPEVIRIAQFIAKRFTS